MVADGDWTEVAKFAAALREPFGDQRGAREAGELLSKMLALGISRFDPDPLQAIAEAEKRRAAK
jgi:hypothetical protein